MHLGTPSKWKIVISAMVFTEKMIHVGKSRRSIYQTSDIACLQHLLSHIAKFNADRLFRLAKNDFVFLINSKINSVRLKALTYVNGISECHSAYRGSPWA